MEVAGVLVFQVDDVIDSADRELDGLTCCVIDDCSADVIDELELNLLGHRWITLLEVVRRLANLSVAADEAAPGQPGATTAKTLYPLIGQLER